MARASVLLQRRVARCRTRSWREEKLDLIWVVGVAPNEFEPVYPVRVIGDDPLALEFVLAVSPEQFELTPFDASPAVRRYAAALTKQRLHQRVFRAQVMNAYRSRCAICHLKHPELLDAAHIIEDGHPNGDPVVPNGIALCKIHHGAFDTGIVGIRPDLTLHVRPDVLEERDGWMLSGGIQGIHNKRLEVLPSKRAARPDPRRLEVRYSAFLAQR